ncbi:MAG TPA: SDR family NAD(P)-dependent oxidoreductase [Polyangiales bacterium]|nr:SDR family NAD(P)-dependent oxidoreductase [Polyangiales bacterium]
MSGRLAGKTAVVTGAGSGIGRAIAIAFGEQGATVMITGRRLAPLEETAAAISSAGGVASTHVLDLTDDNAVSELGQLIDDSLPNGLAFLVNCAAQTAIGSVEDTSVEQLDTLLDTNMRAPFLITRRLLPSLRKAPGDIVFVNSLASFTPRAGVAVYAASKAALRAFADSLRDEVNAAGVRVLSIFPGRTATPMQEALVRQEERDYRPELLLQADDVAAMVLSAVMLPRTAEITELAIRPANKL